MRHFLKYLVLGVTLIAFTVGCEKTETPVGSNQESTPQGQFDIDEITAQINANSAEGQATILEEARKKAGTLPNVKGGAKGVDFNFDQIYSSYSAYYGWRDIHIIDSDEIWGAGNQLQEIFFHAVQTPGNVHPYSIIVPMTQAELNMCYWNGGGVGIEFNVTDENTGITGTRITFNFTSLSWIWVGWEYQEWPTSDFYFYRWNAGEANYWPNMVETDYAFVDGGGNGSIIGPYYLMTFGQQVEAATYNLNGVAFYDVNGNGTQDNGEQGIDGVTVDLSNGASTTTSGGGSYSFADLEDGNYTVTAGDVVGKLHTTSATANVSISGADGSADFGYDDIPTYTISGTVFYDLNGNGAQDGGEPGISGVSVSLSDVGSMSSDANGDYSFADLEGGDYTVSCAAVNGFTATTATSAALSLSADSEVDFGFNFVVGSVNGGSVNGTHGLGWWKENINKAVRGQVRGVQISAAALEALRGTLSTFALPVLNYGSLSDAYTALSYSGGNAASKVAQHFTASEYNYANGSLVNGDAQLTWALMVWGEYVVTNSGNYSRDYLNAVKDLFEHFNGGELEVPDLLQ